MDRRRSSATIAALLVWLSCSVSAAADSRKKSAPSSHRTKYLLIVPHDPEDCSAVISDFRQWNRKLLAKLDWGCLAGDHTGYLIVHAKDEEQALKNLPPPQRDRTRAIRLNKFSSSPFESLPAQGRQSRTSAGEDTAGPRHANAANPVGEGRLK